MVISERTDLHNNIYHFNPFDGGKEIRERRDRIESVGKT